MTCLQGEEDMKGIELRAAKGTVVVGLDPALKGCGSGEG
jgi:hypothetical protein